MRDPERLGKYSIQSVLGEGGMGVVYKGYDPHLARPVAIKTIRRSLLAGRAGRELRERFQREAQAEGRLRHPNIVGIYEFQEDEEGNPFFVMEYVEGKSLKEYLSRGMHFNLEMSARIVSQVLSALSHSHNEGIVHRDIKPANILLLEDDTVKIADFGIARMEDSDFTVSGQVMGTPQYFSPEQRAGKRTDSRTDLYSTGLVLFELLTGEKLFANQADAAKNQRISEEQLAKLDAYPAEAQRILKAIITRALSREPEGRYQHADEFLAELAPLLAKREKPVRLRQKRWWFSGALVLLLAMGGYGWWQYQQPWPFPFASKQPGPTPQKSLSEKDRERVERFLKIADIHLRVGRLILPEGSSAYDAYQMVLNIDPGNSAARAGMDEVQQQVVQRLQQLLASGDVEPASGQLNHAMKVFPDNAALRAMAAEFVDKP